MGREVLIVKKIENRKCTECGNYFPAENFYCTTPKSTGRKQYHSACKDCYKIRMRKWDKKVKEKNNGISRSVVCRSKNLKSYASHIINMAKGRAKKKNIDFTIDVNWFLSSLDNQNWECAISGVKMKVSAGTKSRLFNGISIDRINNNLGYTPENCWLVCYSINAMKSNFDLGDVIKMCKSVAERWDC